MSKLRNPEYWRLVHQLSLLGWYRAGRDINEASDHAVWRFHSGHTIDTSDLQTVASRCVTAQSETSAMRALLKDLRRGSGAARSARADINQKMQHEGSQSFDTAIIWSAPQGGRPN